MTIKLFQQNELITNFYYAFCYRTMKYLTGNVKVKIVTSFDDYLHYFILFIYDAPQLQVFKLSITFLPY
jgi:hypothetical protein